jgi:parvulin-like peptidyl-prolyl isomerase
MAMLQRLTNEQLIKIEAPRYVAEVSPEDIDQELRRIARGESETISESEFKEWYRQLLNEVDLSDSEYREIIATGLLRFRLHGYLADRVPTVAEQVHLYSAQLSTEEIEKMWEKTDGGEDVDKFISEIWQNKQSEGTVEDLGWLPRGVLVAGFDQLAFSLTIGEISEPLAYMSDDPTSDEIFYYYLLMVSEKAAAREIDEDPLQILKAQALDGWLLEETKLHNIEWNFNSEIYAWINWQLAK